MRKIWITPLSPLSHHPFRNSRSTSRRAVASSFGTENSGPLDVCVISTEGFFGPERPRQRSWTIKCYSSMCLSEKPSQRARRKGSFYELPVLPEQIATVRCQECRCRFEQWPFNQPLKLDTPTRVVRTMYQVWCQICGERSKNWKRNPTQAPRITICYV